MYGMPFCIYFFEDGFDGPPARGGIGTESSSNHILVLSGKLMIVLIISNKYHLIFCNNFVELLETGLV